MHCQRITLSVEDLAEARAWIADCAWGDLDPEDIASLTDAEVMRGVERHYDGGLLAFQLDACDVPEVGQPSAHGRTVTCLWCGHTSSRGEHVWTGEEDTRGWECENESACRVRFDARNEA
jgi:hypothetical protein